MISVVLPVKDAEQTLGDAVGSVLAQDHGDLELIVVDDGSDDSSMRIISGFSDPRLRRVENQREPGIVGALTTGVEASRGDWIARMDADDWSHPARLSRQIMLAERDDFDVVGCGVLVTNPQGKGMERYVSWVNGLTDPGDFSRSRFIECPMVHPSALIRRQSLVAAGGYREVTWAEDHDLWLRMLEKGFRFGMVPGSALLEWRDSAGRLTRRHERYSDDSRARMRCYYLNRLPGARERGFVVAGAGPIGKRLVRKLKGIGGLVHGFLEVNPKRIGQIIHGLPVVPARELNTRWPEAILLGAVGVGGGREQVRRLATGMGRKEGGDFWSVC